MLMEQNCIAAITAQEVTISQSHGSWVIFMRLAFTRLSFNNKIKADIEEKYWNFSMYEGCQK